MMFKFKGGGGEYRPSQFLCRAKNTLKILKHCFLQRQLITGRVFLFGGGVLEPNPNEKCGMSVLFYLLCVLFLSY
jgi:hypothetical protein